MKKFFRLSALTILFTVIALNIALPMSSTVETNGAPICIAGGCYASSCEVSAGIDIVGSGATGTISVTCVSGAYACCTNTAHCFAATACRELAD